MPLRDLLTEAIGRVPVADPERCVHMRAEVATCRECVSSCPLDAWSLDDEALTIDAARCDGCGLCVAHCPEEALSQPGVSRPVYPGQESLTISCDLAPGDRKGWPLPCVNAVSLRTITELYSAGLRQLSLQTAGCYGCMRNQDQGLAHRVALLNRVLSQRRLPGIDLIVEQTDRLSGPTGATREEAAAPPLSRRGFFRRMMGAVAEQCGGGGDPAWRAPGEFLPAAGPGDLALSVPQIDPGRCNGCDACIRVCPHEALMLAADSDAFLVRVDACTGCHLCVDICDQDAVTVCEGAQLEERRWPLQYQTCRACGARYHRPIARVGAQPLCHVCSRVNHRRNLFQVL